MNNNKAIDELYIMFRDMGATIVGHSKSQEDPRLIIKRPKIPLSLEEIDDIMLD